MKALIFILLAAMTAEAQTIADVARKERERRAQAKTVRVITSADIKKTGAAPAAAPTPVPAKPSDAAKPAETPGKSPLDIIEEWDAQMQKVRAAIRELQDQETALQLQVNAFTNQVYAPVTTVAARNQAQANLAQAQTNLVTVRKELAETRLKLQQMEAQGPAKK